MKSLTWSPEDIEQHHKDCEESFKEVSERFPDWKPWQDAHYQYGEYTKSYHHWRDMMSGEIPLTLWQFELAYEWHHKPEQDFSDYEYDMRMSSH